MFATDVLFDVGY